MTSLPILQGYPENLQAQARALLESGELSGMLAAKYPATHDIRSNKQLFDFVQQIKAQYMRKAAPLARVTYDGNLRSAHNALGLHVTKARVHGGKVMKKREIRIAAIFKDAPLDFLRMIVVHELAHMKYQDHSAAFYKLCGNLEPDYHQLEFDFRLYLCAQEAARDGLE
ncbi:MAG: putative metal-dependent hydrolase [Planctomycetota bacterium]|jgi:predicted metal-dependent hydrolase